MKVIADLNRCQGHGLCRMAAPELFELREEDGQVIPPAGEIPAGLEDRAQLGVDACPELALSIQE